MKIILGTLFLVSSLLYLSCNSNTELSKNKIRPIEHAISLQTSVLGTQAIATGLDVPWEITWGPDNWIWITEQGGTISRINPETGEKKVLLKIDGIWRKTSSGLLGMAIHPDLKNNPFIVVDYTFRKDSLTFSRLVRYQYEKDSLVNPVVLMEIPGGDGHNGSRVIISKDEKIYWSTGDITIDTNAQNIHSLNGKILRLNMDGTIPTDNPFQNSPVWAYGFRNMQGLVLSPAGLLYTSEHGDDTDDEVNLVEKSRNYGWPFVRGLINKPNEDSFQALHLTTQSLIAWTPTIAPSGIDYYAHNVIPEWENALLVTSLKAESLHVLTLDKNGRTVKADSVYINKTFGRLRDLCVSPDGDIYISTSNRDWNPPKGFPVTEDDRIIRIFKLSAAEIAANKETILKDAKPNPDSMSSASAQLYIQYCASCHKEDGKGVSGSFPSLVESSLVKGNKKSLVKFLEKGSAGTTDNHTKAKEQKMPAFDFLNDEKLAIILSYIRNNWGNKYGDILPAEVKQLRETRK
jgi:glucose/arabinose dehydrogenase/mono/diheme cytochrome c family protein